MVLGPWGGVIDSPTSESFVVEVVGNTRLRNALALNVQEAAAHRLTLHLPSGRQLRDYESHIIEPQAPLADTLDFSPEAITSISYEICTPRSGTDSSHQIPEPHSVVYP